MGNPHNVPNVVRAEQTRIDALFARLANALDEGDMQSSNQLRTQLLSEARHHQTPDRVHLPDTTSDVLQRHQKLDFGVPGTLSNKQEEEAIKKLFSPTSHHKLKRRR